MSNEKKAKKGTLSILSKEYKYENLILAFLAVFAIVLVGLGVISLLLVALPFYKPSFDEAKHITGLKKSEFLVNIARVLIFIFILAGFFFLCDLALDPLMDLFK